MNTLPRILIAGELKVEYLFSTTGKLVVDQPGGNILYAAAGAALWSEGHHDIGLISKIGSNFPEESLEKVIDHGFNIGGVNRVDSYLEHRTFTAYSDLRTSYSESPISFFSKTGEEFPVSLLGYQVESYGSDQNSVDDQFILSEKDFPEDLRYANAAHLCPLDMQNHQLFPDLMRRADINFISIDPGDRYMQPTMYNEIPTILQGLTAFLPSERELVNLFQGRSDDIWEMMEALGSMGCSYIVVKSGEDGQKLYCTDSKKRYHVPAFPSNLVDITGAGDVFCGGFIAGLEKENDPLQAVLFGNIAASFAVEGSGAFYTDDVMEGLQLARLEKLKTFVREI
jgi:sugar/nucleoside kinase (ribokinase family)